MYMKRLIECKEKIDGNIPKKRRENTFWCPKNKDGDEKKPGFILYAYGGQVLQLYVSGNGIDLSLFNKKYTDYLEKEAKERLEKVYDKLKNDEDGSEERLKRLEEIVESDWDVILSAFESRAYGIKESHQHLERARETAIARRNDGCIPDGIKIIEVESRIPAEGKKPDMIGVRMDQGQPVLSYIEYKCTKNAMNGNCRPVDHFIDMQKYYQCPFRYFEDFDKRLGEPVLLKGGIDKAKKEIVFLFSHVGKGNELTEQKVINSLRKILECKVKGSIEHVRVVIIKDEKCDIMEKDFLSVHDAIKQLEEKRLKR